MKKGKFVIDIDHENNIPVDDVMSVVHRLHPFSRRARKIRPSVVRSITVAHTEAAYNIICKNTHRLLQEDQ